MDGQGREQDRERNREKNGEYEKDRGKRKKRGNSLLISHSKDLRSVTYDTEFYCNY